jgi:DNA-binding response OmpR family regulator
MRFRRNTDKAAPDPAVASAVGKTVLVVDDDTYVALLLSMELPGVSILEAARMSEALPLAAESDPAAVVIDRRLPDGDGLDLVRRLRTSFPTTQTPIVVITAGHDEAHRSEVLKAGADEYLAKPVNPPELLGCLARILDIPPSDRRERRTRLLDRIRRAGGAAGSSDKPSNDEPPDDASPAEGRSHGAG